LHRIIVQWHWDRLSGLGLVRMRPSSPVFHVHLIPQRRAVTLPRRSPVDSEKAAMSDRCGGRCSSSRSASSRNRYRTRRVGSFRIRALGARSIHSQSSAHFLKMARRTSMTRLTVAGVTPSLCFAAGCAAQGSRALCSGAATLPGLASGPQLHGVPAVARNPI
jgi:hypothetical protein